MGGNPHANGGLLLKALQLPDFRDYAVALKQPGQTLAESPRVMGTLLRDVMKANLATRNFRVMGPDEPTSNRLGALFNVFGFVWFVVCLFVVVFFVVVVCVL